MDQYGRVSRGASTTNTDRYGNRRTYATKKSAEDTNVNLGGVLPNIAHALSGGAIGYDADVLPGYSLPSGDREPESGLYGKTQYPSSGGSLPADHTSNTTANTGGAVPGDQVIGGGGGGVIYRPNDDARNRAYLDRELNRFDSYFGDVDNARDVRLGQIDNEFNISQNRLGQIWADAQEDHNTATNQRLRSRARQVGVADDDFKRQNDAYSRFFARHGAGSSSAAMHTVPSLLARAASKVRSEVEEKNAENADLQLTAFNRAKRDHDTNLDSLKGSRQQQIDQAEADWRNKRSELFGRQADLQRQRDTAAGQSYESVLANSQGLIDQADRLRREAIDQQAIKPEFKVAAQGYTPALQKDWDYNSTETKVEDNQDEEDPYSRYYRDEEERKKRDQGWI